MFAGTVRKVSENSIKNILTHSFHSKTGANSYSMGHNPSNIAKTAITGASLVLLGLNKIMEATLIGELPPTEATDINDI